VSGVESRLHVENEVGKFWWTLLIDLIGVYDSILLIFRIGVFLDYDGASTLNLVELKRILVLLREFNILAKESDVVVPEVLVFIIISFFDELLLNLACSDPGEKLHVEFAAQVDHILEMDIVLLHLVLTFCLQVP
jgi:hypothetical protein